MNTKGTTTTIPLRFSWSEIMPALIHLLRQPKLDAEAKKDAVDTLNKCARIADMYVKSVQDKEAKAEAQLAE